SRTAGTFDGLPEGARFKLADTVYRIRYNGGDGNDVVLTATGDSPAPGTRTEAAAGRRAVATRTANTAADGFGWWPYVLALGLLGGLVFPATLRTRGKGRRRGWRHAAPG